MERVYTTFVAVEVQHQFPAALIDTILPAAGTMDRMRVQEQFAALDRRPFRA